ncbi:MAG: D-sedoheptulose-7-phosphate isomerase [Candidatus Aquicultorales bacterium]
MNNKIVKQFGESIEVKRKLVEDPNAVQVIADVASLIIEAYRAGGKVLFMGNGGSAADAQHLACELVSKFGFDREALPAIALNVNSSLVTAIGNDYGFDNIFARQVEAWARTGDVVVGISTSGNSANIVRALKKAVEMGASTVGFTGQSGGEVADVADVCLKVPSGSTPRIQEAHIVAGHIVCSLVEEGLFGEANGG